MPAVDTGVAAEVAAAGRAMASRIDVRVALDRPDDPDERRAARAAVAAAVEVFHRVDATCTRFDPASDLMRANAAPDRWTAVDPLCFDALVAAESAYRRTHGRFDPRVLADLVRLGYDRSMRAGPPSRRTAAALVPRMELPPWRPEFRRADHQVRLGSPVDLGGIGKGLAVRWAAERLAGVGAGQLVSAGGDCRCAGRSPEGGPWRVAVEDPADTPEPVAVLEVADAAVATSSIRIRQWQVAGRPVHHLIDPATGQPGGDGLAAVTVVGDDPADAEVWSKCLFLTGRRGVATSAAYLGLAALWVGADGAVGTSPAMAPHLSWVRR